MFEIGSFLHILLCLPIPFLIYTGSKIKHKDVFLYYASFALFILEIGKQFYYLINHTWTVWIIPFQLCSLPLYYFMFSYTKYKNAYQIFIHDYILIAAIFALLYPQDMIHSNIFLTIHAFLWHYILVMMSSIQIEGSFKSSTNIFLIACSMATIFNVTFASFGEINCFYISCLYPSSQPFFSYIGKQFGILFQVICYILSIIIGSYIIKKIRHVNSCKKLVK